MVKLYYGIKTIEHDCINAQAVYFGVFNLKEKISDIDDSYDNKYFLRDYKQGRIIQQLKNTFEDFIFKTNRPLVPSLFNINMLVNEYQSLKSLDLFPIEEINKYWKLFLEDFNLINNQQTFIT